MGITLKLHGKIVLHAIFNPLNYLQQHLVEQDTSLQGILPNSPIARSTALSL